MSKELKSSEIIKLIDNNIDYCKDTLKTFTTNEKTTLSKKAMLVAYWIRDYINLLKSENTFKASKLPKYKRGDIVSVNFGFRIGNELGGRHFAIVVDNHNDINSNIITVIPLTSKKEETKLGRYNYELSYDLPILYKEKYDKLLGNNLQKAKSIIDKLKNIQNNSEYNIAISKKEADELLKEIRKVKGSLNNLSSFKVKMDKLKNGSIVNISQITTISKQRILNPKQSKDALTGIKIKTEDLDNINSKIKKLFIFDKIH